MLSNNTLLETRIQWLHDGLIFVEKGLGVHVQRMHKMSRGIILAEIFSKILGKKRRKIEDLICNHDLTINDLVPTYFLLKYIMRSLLAQLPPLHSENVD